MASGEGEGVTRCADGGMAVDAVAGCNSAENGEMVELDGALIEAVTTAEGLRPRRVASGECHGDIVDMWVGVGAKVATAWRWGGPIDAGVALRRP